MKRILFFLMILTSTFSYGQIQHKLFFDFTNPKALTPSVTPEVYHQGMVLVVDSTFKNRDISVRFEKSESILRPYIETWIDGNDTTYNLQFTGSSKMIVECGESSNLDSIYMDDSSLYGDIYLDGDKPGKLDMWKKWIADGANDVRKVKFGNSSHASSIHKLIIVYTTKADVLEPTVDPVSASTIDSLKSLTLTFEKDVTMGSGTISVKNSDGTEVGTMAAALEGNVVTLTINNVQKADGTYTVNIPDGLFTQSDGFKNKELTYTYTVVAPKNTFNPTSVTPTPGNVRQSLPTTVGLTFPSEAKLQYTDASISRNGGDTKVVKMAVSSADNKIVELTIPTYSETAVGDVFTIEIAAQSIHNEFYGTTSPDNVAKDRWSKAMTISYTITDKDPDSPEVTLARQLLAKTGVGYPLANSQARIDLAKDTVFTGGVCPAATVVQPHIDAFYKATDVVKPSTGKWYTIAAVNDGTSKLYLTFKDAAISLTDNVDEATAFKADSLSDGKITMSTADGFYYLTTLCSSTDYSKANGKSVSAAPAAAENQLSFNKLKVSNVEASKMFGLFTMYGLLGDNSVSTTSNVNAWALINHADKKIITAENGVRQFGSDRSSAFVIEETVDPSTKVYDVTLTPTVIIAETVDTLKFSDDYAVAIADGTLAYLTNSASATTSVTLTTVAGKANSFTFSVAGIVDGEYTLTVPKGSFTAVKDSKKYSLNAFDANVTVQKDMSEYKTTFNSYSVLDEPSEETPVADTRLNEVVLWIYNFVEPSFVPDETKDVWLYNSTTAISREVKVGHFMRYTIPGETEKVAIRLTLDEPIKHGDLTSGKYTFRFDTATFGDANFGYYISGVSSTLRKSDCRVNPTMYLTFRVNNSITGIQDVDADADADVKDGKFMENGKIVIYKGGKRYSLSGMLLK